MSSPKEATSHDSEEKSRSTPEESNNKEPVQNPEPDQIEVSTSKNFQEEISALKKELEKEKANNLNLSKRMLYLQADFANLQRQSERRVAEARDETKLRFIEELVSLKEDLERAMSVSKALGAHNLFDGLKMLLSRVEGILRSEEVAKISVSVGSAFDPRLHEAVAYSEGGNEKEGTILSVVSNGYTMRGKVIKPTLVEVARQSQGLIQTNQSPEPGVDSLREETKAENQSNSRAKERPLKPVANPNEKGMDAS